MFQVVIGGDTLPQRKPSPEPVLAAIAGLNTVLKEVVMIGDNIYDVDAGHRAGIPVIAVSYGYPRMLVTDLNADLIIDRFDKLPWALERLSHSLT
jgi:phosphoglycolate phosphatase